MKKYVFLSLLVAIAPNVCLGASSRVTTLMREKQRKMEELEKCTGSKKGLMIAGVSTLGLTAVGVAGNIAEASKIKSLDSEINKTDRNIEKTRNEIEQIKREKIEREERERQLAQEQLEEHNRTHALSTVLAEDINNITQNSGVVGGIAYTRGYTPNQLNGSLGSQLKSAMSLFMEKCMDLAVNKTDHIKSVNITASDKSYWDNFISNGTLDANTILENLNQNTIKQCQATECDDANYKVEAGKCVYTTAGASVVGTVSDADENLIDVTIVDGDSDQHTDGDGVVAVVQGVVQNGTETACSAEKLTELHAESGNMVDGVCIITKCLGDLAKSSDSKSCACPSHTTPKSNDATKCVAKSCTTSQLNTLKADKGTLKADGTCKITKCKGELTIQDNLCKCPTGKTPGSVDPTLCVDAVFSYSFAGVKIQPCPANKLPAHAIDGVLQQDGSCQVASCEGDLRAINNFTECGCPGGKIPTDEIHCKCPDDKPDWDSSGKKCYKKQSTISTVGNHYAGTGMGPGRR